jgi:hypothetical protein
MRCCAEFCREKYVTKLIVTWNKVTQECGSEGLNNPAYSSAPIPIGNRLLNVLEIETGEHKRVTKN